MEAETTLAPTFFLEDTRRPFFLEDTRRLKLGAKQRGKRVDHSPGNRPIQNPPLRHRFP